MTQNYTVGDLVAEFLSACGVTTVFGIASVHNIPMLDAIGRRNTIRFMMARGELGGAHMADGYARVNQGLGVIFSSTGPGAASDRAKFHPVRRPRHGQRARSERPARYDGLGVQGGLSRPIGAERAGRAYPGGNRGAECSDGSGERGGADRPAAGED